MQKAPILPAQVAGLFSIPAHRNVVLYFHLAFPVQIIGQSKRQISSLTDEYKHSSLEFPLFSFFLFPRSHKTPKRGTDIINRLVCPSHVFATFLQIHLIESTLS